MKKQKNRRNKANDGASGIGAGKIFFTQAILKFRAGIFLTCLLFIAYFFFSGGRLFIETQKLLSLSFSLGQPANIFAYMFAHIGVWHLAANALCIFLFAAIIETALGSLDVFFIFLFSGGLAAITFSLLNPNAGLIGASGGAAGLMSSALVLRPLKSAIALAGLTALLLLSMHGVNTVVWLAEQKLQDHSSELQEQLQQAIASGDESRVAEISRQGEQAEKELGGFIEGKRFSLQMQTDPFVHSYAAAFGMLYLFLFRRKKLAESAAKTHASASRAIRKFTRRS